MRLVVLLLFIAVLRIFYTCGLNENTYICLSQIEESSRSNQHVYPFILSIRERITSEVYKILPSPHSELFLGTTLGINNLKNVPTFNDVLRYTGTIHVVVVSGYNISLVYNFIFSVLKSKYKFINVLIGILVTGFYALIAGFEPPVVRAWIMGTLTVMSTFYGYKAIGTYVLLASGLLMLILSPYLLVSLSFQLSFMATLGILLYSDIVGHLVGKLFGSSVFSLDLSTSIAAQLFVWPLISHYIGTTSLISPLINALLIWTIAPITSIGILSVLMSLVSNWLLKLGIFIVFPLMDIFISGVYYLSDLPYLTYPFKVSLLQMSVYYLLLIYLKKYAK